jgi:hypothetical protein
VVRGKNTEEKHIQVDEKIDVHDFKILSKNK